MTATLSKETLLGLNGVGEAASIQLTHDVQQFLYKEARLLNSEQLHQWYEGLADDLVYWAPTRENILRKNQAKRSEFAVNRCALFDEDKQSIALRLKRVDSGMCWTEDPPTRQVYAISNVEVFHTPQDNEFEVHSVFTLYRSRFERDESTLMGRRKDILRLEQGQFKLAARLVLLQQSTLLAKNLSTFF